MATEKSITPEQRLPGRGTPRREAETHFAPVISKGKLVIFATGRGKNPPRKAFDTGIEAEDEASTAKLDPVALANLLEDKLGHLTLESSDLEPKTSERMIHYMLAKKMDFPLRLLDRAFKDSVVSLRDIEFTHNRSAGTVRQNQIIRVRYREREGLKDAGKDHTLVRSFGVESIDENTQQLIARAIAAKMYKALKKTVTFSTEEFKALVEGVIAGHKQHYEADRSSTRKIDIDPKKVAIGPLTLMGPYFSPVSQILRVEFRIKHTVDNDSQFFFRVDRSLGRRMGPEGEYPDVPAWMRDRIERAFGRLEQALGTFVKEYGLEQETRPFATLQSEGGTAYKLAKESDKVLFEDIAMDTLVLVKTRMTRRKGPSK
ncbi:MAG: hypothetical protein EB060_03765 [Proteobacteria bacterium]|nr:hypothetical protein [Pseudomonadota bacterium]